MTDSPVVVLSAGNKACTETVDRGIACDDAGGRIGLASGVHGAGVGGGGRRRQRRWRRPQVTLDGELGEVDGGVAS